MLLTPYASSSKGNLYQVYDGQTRILLECGLPINKLHMLLPFPLGANVACLITHEHKDHSRSADDLMRRGIDVYMTAGTAAALACGNTACGNTACGNTACGNTACGNTACGNTACGNNPRLHIITAGMQFEVGTLRVKPFSAVHDGREPCGFLLHSAATGERLMFATDTASIPYRFAQLTEIAIECNHSREQLEESSLPAVVRERARHTHMSLESACAWLIKSDLSTVQRIWLLHLSAAHGDADGFERVVRQITGVDTRACGDVVQHQERR